MLVRISWLSAAASNTLSRLAAGHRDTDIVYSKVCGRSGESGSRAVGEYRNKGLGIRAEGDRGVDR